MLYLFYHLSWSSLLPAPDPYCPIYGVKNMTDRAGVDNFTSIITSGGVIGVDMSYNCDLDKDKHTCKPEVSFTRIDRQQASV